MRYGRFGLVSAMVLGWAMATAGCGSYDDDDPAGTAGTDGSGGAATGTGGAATGSGGAPAGVGGGASNPVTTLDVTAALNALPEAEVTQLCDDSYAYYGSTITTEVFCKWRGLKYATSSSAPSDEQLRSNCSSTEATCLADPVAAMADNPGCNRIPETCTATVADYVACVMDHAAAFTVTVNAIPGCDVLTMADTSMVWDAQGGTGPASCDYTTTCQGLYPPNPLL